MAIMHAVQAWRAEGMPVCYTIDAGPNVHVLCPAGDAEWVNDRLLPAAWRDAGARSPPGWTCTDCRRLAKSRNTSLILRNFVSPLEFC